MSGGFKNLVIGFVFNYCGTVRDMEKRMIPLNSACRIDIDIILNILDTVHLVHNHRGVAYRVLVRLVRQ